MDYTKGIKYIRVFIILLVIVFLIFLLDVSVSKQVAVRYLDILTIEDKESYEEVRKRIRNISPEEVQDSLFRVDREFEDIKVLWLGVDYKVEIVELAKINGFRDYDIRVIFNSKGFKTVSSIKRVVNWKVVEVFREDREVCN